MGTSDAPSRHGETVLAFYAATRAHVLAPPTVSGFSYCGVWAAGAASVDASAIAEVDRCGGACKNRWPAESGRGGR